MRVAVRVDLQRMHHELLEGYRHRHWRRHGGRKKREWPSICMYVLLLTVAEGVCVIVAVYAVETKGGAL
jgi:hypothetical protein